MPLEMARDRRMRMSVLIYAEIVKTEAACPQSSAIEPHIFRSLVMKVYHRPSRDDVLDDAYLVASRAVL